MKDFFYAIGDMSQWIFANVIEKLGSIPNVIIILVLLGAMAYWINLQIKFTKKAKDEGGII